MILSFAPKDYIAGIAAVSVGPIPKLLVFELQYTPKYVNTKGPDFKTL